MQKVRCTRGPKRGGHTEIISIVCTPGEKEQKVGWDRNRGRKTVAIRNEHFEKTLWWGTVEWCT